ELVVPLALAGLQVYADQALGEEVVAGTMAAVEIGRRRFDRQIHQAEIFIDGDLRPHAGVPVYRPRLVLPRVVPEFAGARDRVERAHLLAGLHVERAHEPFAVVVRRDRRALAHRRADNDDVLDHGGGGVDTDLAGLEIDRLALALHDTELQIEDAGL